MKPVLPPELRAGLAAVDPDAVAAVELEDPWIETEEQAHERRARQQRLKQERWHSRLPLDYAEASVLDFPEEQQASLSAVLADPKVRNVVLAGPVGTGKTHAAYALGRAVVEGGGWVEAWSVYDLMREYMPEGDRVLMDQRAKGCTLLILDDLGASKASEFAQETLTSILDARVSRGRKTVVTTNSTEEQLRAVWGARLVDRLWQGLVAVTFEGESRRRPAW